MHKSSSSSEVDNVEDQAAAACSTGQWHHNLEQAAGAAIMCGMHIMSRADAAPADQLASHMAAATSALGNGQAIQGKQWQGQVWFGRADGHWEALAMQSP